MRYFLLLVLMLGCVVTPLHAQEHTSTPVITWNNLGSLSEVGFFISTDLAAVNEVAWSSDNRTVAIATQKGVWLYTLEDTASPVLLGGVNTPVGGVAFHPNGHYLATALGNIVRIWDIKTQGIIGDVNGSAPVTFSQDGRLLATANGSYNAVIWDVATLQPIASTSGHTDTITDIDFNPNGVLLATSSLDMTMRLWDTRTGEQMAFQRSRRRPLLSTAFSPNGYLVASGTERGIMRLLNVAIEIESTYSRREWTSILDVSFSPDASLIAFATANQLYVWNVNETTLHPAILPHTEITSAAFSHDGRHIASGGRDGVVRIWGVK